MTQQEMLAGFGLSERAQESLTERVLAGLSKEPDWEALVKRVHRSVDRVRSDNTLLEVHLGGFLAALQVTHDIDVRTAIRVGGRKDYARLSVRYEEHMDKHRMWAIEEGVLARWERFMDYCDTWGARSIPREIIPSLDMGEHGFLCCVGENYVFGMQYDPKKKDWSVHS